MAMIFEPPADTADGTLAYLLAAQNGVTMAMVPGFGAPETNSMAVRVLANGTRVIMRRSDGYGNGMLFSGWPLATANRADIFHLYRNSDSLGNLTLYARAWTRIAGTTDRYSIELKVDGTYTVVRFIQGKGSTTLATGTWPRPTAVGAFTVRQETSNSALESDPLTPCVRLKWSFSSGGADIVVEDSSADRIQTAGVPGYYSTATGILYGYYLTGIAGEELAVDGLFVDGVGQVRAPELGRVRVTATVTRTGSVSLADLEVQTTRVSTGELVEDWTPVASAVPAGDNSVTIQTTSLPERLCGSLRFRFRSAASPDVTSGPVEFLVLRVRPYEPGANWTAAKYYSGSNPYRDLALGGEWRAKSASDPMAIVVPPGVTPASASFTPAETIGMGVDMVPTQMPPLGGPIMLMLPWVVPKAGWHRVQLPPGTARPTVGGAAAAARPWDGAADDPANGRYRLWLESGPVSVTSWLIFNAIPPGGRLTVSIIHEDDLDDTRLLNPVFRRDIQNAAWLRAMSPQWINGVSPATLADRIPGTACLYPENSTGLPIEAMVRMANEERKHLTVNIHHMHDQTLRRWIIQYVKDHLAPGLKVLWEYGNETWNSQFKVYVWLKELALAEGVPGANEGIQVCKMYARKIVEMTNDLVDIYGASFGTDACQVLLNAQQGSFAGRVSLALDEEVEGVAAWQRIHWIAYAPYFTVAEAGGIDTTLSGSAAVDAVIAKAQVTSAAHINDLTAQARLIAAWCEAKGLPADHLSVMTYENGEHTDTDYKRIHHQVGLTLTKGPANSADALSVGVEASQIYDIDYKMTIDGVLYERGKHYTFNKATQTIDWSVSPATDITAEPAPGTSYHITDVLYTFPAIRDAIWAAVRDARMGAIYDARIRQYADQIGGPDMQFELTNIGPHGFGMQLSTGDTGAAKWAAWDAVAAEIGTGFADNLTLSDLTLDNDEVPENTPEGTLIGAVLGDMAGTLSLTDDAGGLVKLVDGQILRGSAPLDYGDVQSFEIAITETQPAATNSPHVSTIGITVLEDHGGGGGDFVGAGSILMMPRRGRRF